MHYLDQFHPIFDWKRIKNHFLWKRLIFLAKRKTGTTLKPDFNMGIGYVIFTKMAILGATGLFWPNLRSETRIQGLLSAITFEPIELQSSATMQNVAFIC